MDRKDIWDSIVSHVYRGEQAEELLESIYCEVGPYGRDKISDETWVKVCKFFNFDDSE